MAATALPGFYSQGEYSLAFKYLMIVTNCLRAAPAALSFCPAPSKRLKKWTGRITMSTTGQKALS
ncbi:MAG TPA: hypothetical protein VF600_02330 [Abditibacteriaceae bacterium]